MRKDFDEWNNRKKQLNESEFAGYVHEREVWWCALGINIGVEADGKHGNFERPVLVLRKFNRDAVLIVPLTSRAKPNPYQWPFSHDGKSFAAVLSQMRLISTRRLLRKMYRMDRRIFEDIKARIISMMRYF
jgi:mRNA interferase MazF